MKRRINGIVTDPNNEPLIGVTLTIPGTNTGTVTNANGRFELEIPADTKTIQASYIGYATQKVGLTAGKTTFNIVLDEDVALLSEVVVVGYGTQKKVNLTGSVATVNLEKNPVHVPPWSVLHRHLVV